jgi:hypothetical protein
MGRMGNRLRLLVSCFGLELPNQRSKAYLTRYRIGLINIS